MAVKTSFKKKSSSKPDHPRGTRPSLHNTQLQVSTGVPSLDSLLGGGLNLGSLLLVEEDSYEHYSRLLLKYFLAEGIMCGHSFVLSSVSEVPEDIINDLPAAIFDNQGSSTMPTLTEHGEEEDIEGGDKDANDEMKIAWQYKKLPKVQFSFSNQFGHSFDLTKKMERSRIDAVNQTFLNVMDCKTKSTEMYQNLTEVIIQSLSDGKFARQTYSQLQQRTVLRVVIHSLGSPLWLQDASTNSSDLPRLLHSLRGILRETNSVALITVPTHLFQDLTYVRRLERLCDSVIQLESFEGSEKEQNPIYKEYHGLFHLIKLPRINSLTCHYPETLDLAFKLKRKRFLIEKLHLPPELSETANRAQEDTVQPARVTKGTRTKTSKDHITISKHNIDF